MVFKCLCLAIVLALPVYSAEEQSRQSEAKGTVFHDLNGNGKKDLGEKGIKGVKVSNQKDVTVTDGQGRWTLPVHNTNDTTFFVVKPSGWKTPLNHHNLPKFYYIHKPAGSPPVKFGGVKPTGPLPKSIDFPLRKQKEPETFKVIFFGDPQPRNQKEVEYIGHDVVEELVGTDAKFGVTLGDIAFDNLDTFEPLNATIALIGIPWYNVIGNHDINYDTDHDHHSDETFERVYGPNYYSFDYGQVHFIVLDDVKWEGQKPMGTGKYSAGLGPEQIEFVKNDLALAPEKKLVVLMMHIPLNGVADRQELYRLIENRPYTLSVSGHTHYQEHRFITREDGWRGPEPHQHFVSVTVSGSWWSGVPDEVGVPHTTMRDGAPNGYSIITFDGAKAKIDFKAARSPADYQINIHAPDKVTAAQMGETFVYANVFNGSIRSHVEIGLSPAGPWEPMQKVLEPDPFFLIMKETEKEFKLPGRKLPEVIPSPHLWKSHLPKDLRPGIQNIYVRHTDMYGRVNVEERVINIVE
ncbi:MAG: calcineurin-like phosphoesterase C-terminal domain-containing protein [Verrucomicrobiales bacterium]